MKYFLFFLAILCFCSTVIAQDYYQGSDYGYISTGQEVESVYDDDYSSSDYGYVYTGQEVETVYDDGYSLAITVMFIRGRTIR